MPLAWWNRASLLLALTASAGACGQSIHHGQHSAATEAPSPHAGGDGSSAASGGSGAVGGATAAGGLGGSGGTLAEAGVGNDPDAGVDDLPLVRTADIPLCEVLTPSALAEQARGDAGIAVDADNVYFVGLRGVSSVPKDGGEVSVLGPADDTNQVAVDADNVYFGGRSFWSASKEGGEATLLLDGQVIGVVGTEQGVYFTNWGLPQTSLQRWSNAGGFELVYRFDAAQWVDHLVADENYVYLAPTNTQPAQDIRRIGLAGGASETIAAGDTVRGVAAGRGNFYFSEEATHTVKEVSGDELVTRPLVRFEDFPTGLAVDERYLYVNLQALIPGGTKYHGHLVRLGSNGALCEMSASIEYGQSVAVDESSIYWIGDRKVWTTSRTN